MEGYEGYDFVKTATGGHWEAKPMSKEEEAKWNKEFEERQAKMSPTEKMWQELVNIEYVLTQGYYEGGEEEAKLTEELIELRVRHDRAQKLDEVLN